MPIVTLSKSMRSAAFGAWAAAPALAVGDVACGPRWMGAMCARAGTLRMCRCGICSWRSRRSPGASVASIETRVAPISVDDVMGADELFFSGTAVEVTAIREVDGRVIGDGKPGPVTRRIQETFNQAVRGQLPQYRRWLSFVSQPVSSRV